MRFCDLFLEYQYAMQEVKSTIPWVKLPFYRKLFILLDFLLVIGGVISYILGLHKLVFVLIFLLITLIFVFIIIDSNKRNIRKMLDDNYLPYSEKRMSEFLLVLEKYNIKPSDKDKLELLIEEAKTAKNKANPLLPLSKPIKVLGTIVIPIIAFVAQKIADTTSIDDLISMAIMSLIIIICIFSMLFAIIPTLKDLLYRDSKYYDDLIYDLRQTIIFYKD